MSATGLPIGLYETLVSEAVQALLVGNDPELVVTEALASAEAPNRLALHVSRLVETAMNGVPEAQRVQLGLDVVRGVIEAVQRVTDIDVTEEALVDAGEVLKAVGSRRPDGSRSVPRQPLTPLLDTTLLTNSKDEPRIGLQLESEIASAEHVDVLMAFIRKSGIAMLLGPLREVIERGGRVRVLTTTYTGSTQVEALEQLVNLGAKVKVSYDVSSTRLHAKAWLLHRPGGFTTAYIGSSNLTHQAQVTGLEWNVRASAARNPDLVQKMRAVFDTYWESSDFEAFDAEQFAARTLVANAGPVVYLSPVGVTPQPFQSRLLELLSVARSQGHHRNLLVSATGTGKTVMAALDYADLAARLPRSRLLFVAHRQEILDQSQATFRHVLRDPSFGEQWIGGRRPQQFDHVFASVQSLNHVDLDHLDSTHFDIVIIDEFHHAAAASYSRVLDHLRPVELLGLTATPERTDGLPILHWFDGRIAAELRLWDAIDQGYLSPFVYYGIFDGVDLRDVPWRRGHGYDVEGLTNLLTANDVWARFVVKQFVARSDDVTHVRALGFCVSIDHARFMARVFNDAGIAAEAIWADTDAADRSAALRRLASGHTKVIFSVDLFNEGVDVPSVDTLLLLRPTESATLFLQQLGRGLRKQADKSSCLVLDFVGLHRREFRFDLKLRALLGGTRKDLEGAVLEDFPFLPAGCSMHLDRQTQEIVLASIRSALPANASQRADELRRMAADASQEVSLASYLDHSGLDLDDVYADGKSSWSDLRERAGLGILRTGPAESVVRRALGRLLHFDDPVRLAFATRLAEGRVASVDALSERERRLLRMMTSQLFDQASESLPKTASLQDALELLLVHEQVRDELGQLARVLLGRINHELIPLDSRPDVPLLVHARYTRREILAGFDHGAGPRTTNWQSGVFWLPDARADVSAVTLDKSVGHFSPTTRYRDYAISRDLFHWETQSVTRAASPTGLRYQHHVEMGTEMYFFVRLRQTDRAFWFVGPATYVRHEGERPMAITWRLHVPLPADVYSTFAVA